MNNGLYKLSPSDFRYLWNDCKHCYYKKIKYKVALPSIGLPGVFSRMNSLLQDSIVGMNLQDINPDLPSGIIEVKEGFLKSKPVPGAEDCYLSGRFDIVSKLDDGTYAVIDFKITDPKEDLAQKFSSQLHAYKYALENPVNTLTPPKQVSKMGLITVAPEAIQFVNGKVVFTSNPKWHDISLDIESLFSLVGEISKLLNGPIPEPSENCAWCKFKTGKLGARWRKYCHSYIPSRHWFRRICIKRNYE